MSIRPLPPALAEIAKSELNEDPKILKDDLQHLKDWIAKQPHLRARTDDQWLVAFLRGCKFSLERTKEKLDLYYSLRTTAPDLHRVKHTDPMFDAILRTGTSLIMPKTTGPGAPRVYIVRPGRYDPEKFNIMDVMSVVGVIQKIVMMDDDNAIIAGSVTLFDMEGVGIGHILQMTPSVMKKMAVSGQDAAPRRLKAAHYINTPKGMETVFNAMNSLLNEKNRSRLYVHNTNYEEMYKHISKDVLPAEYGGNGGTTEEIVDYWRKKVKEYSAFLEEDYKYGTDESKRPGKPKTAEDMFGLEGSFRKLDLD